ncbi:MAG: permease-like cell division protein FtsX [Syntrophobacteraceae bacterium]
MTQLQRTFDIMRTDPWTAGARGGVLVCCMLACGLISVILFNFQQAVPTWMLDADVVAYVRGDVPAADQERIAAEMRQWPEVEKVRAVPRDGALKRFEAQLGDWKGILDGLPDNPLPPSLEIVLKTKAKQNAEAGGIVGKIRQYPEVQEVFYGKTWADKLEFVVNFIRTWGLGALGFLTLAAVLVIAGAVSLAASSFRKELEIYRIVGATPFFERFPFYAEGMIEGGASAMLAACLLAVFMAVSRSILPFPFSAALFLKAWEMVFLAAGLMICGIAVGWIGAHIGLRNVPHI